MRNQQHVIYGHASHACVRFLFMDLPFYPIFVMVYCLYCIRWIEIRSEMCSWTSLFCCLVTRILQTHPNPLNAEQLVVYCCSQCLCLVLMRLPGEWYRDLYYMFPGSYGVARRVVISVSKELFANISFKIQKTLNYFIAGSISVRRTITTLYQW